MKRAMLEVSKLADMEAEIRQLRATLEAIRDHAGVEAAASTNPVTASFLAFISGKAAQALEKP